MPVNPHVKGGSDVPVTSGGTGASDASTGLSNLGGLDSSGHAVIDHAGIPGVGDLTAAAHATTDHTGITGVPFDSQATIFSADLGSGSSLGAATTDFSFGFTSVLFAVPFIANHLPSGDDNVQITGVALNTPVAGTVRVSFTKSGSGNYDVPLFIGCSAFGT